MSALLPLVLPLASALVAAPGAAPTAPCPYQRRPSLRARHPQPALTLVIRDPDECPVPSPDLVELSQQLNWVRCLRQDKLPKSTEPRTPKFARLFTHETWASYQGVPTLTRWWRALQLWRLSTVLRSVYPCVVLATAWAALVGWAARSHNSLLAGLPLFAGGIGATLPLSLQGTAIGLLLVFRTNGSYERLAEARDLWSQVIFSCREVAQGSAVALRKAGAEQALAQVSRYLACLGWELSARLRDGGETNDEVLKALLPLDEAEFISRQRSAPLALIGGVRRVLYDQLQEGNIPPHLHYKLEEDMRSIDLCISGCERLFSSPIPPTMSRHVIRCLLIWLFALPLVLASQGAALWANSLWVGATAYIFIGIEEVGSQVEQPFQVMPLYQLSDLIQRNVEECLLTPNDPCCPIYQSWLEKPGAVAG